MKKIIFILGFALLAIVGYSQNKTVDYVLDYAETYLLWDGTTNALDTGDSLWTYTVQKKMDGRMYCYVDMLIDSVGGTADTTVWIYLENKMFPDQDYTVIDSTSWDGEDEAVVSFTPTKQTFSYTASGKDSITGKLAYPIIRALTDTAGLEGYPADSIKINAFDVTLTTVVVKPTTWTMSINLSNQDNCGEYWRIRVNGLSDSLKAIIRRLNFKFIKQ
jgi:hypothetical protein